MLKTDMATVQKRFTDVFYRFTETKYFQMIKMSDSFTGSLS